MRRRFWASGSVASPKRTPKIAAGTTVASDGLTEVASADVGAAPRADEPADGDAGEDRERRRGPPVAPEADQPEHHRADGGADPQLGPVERRPHRVVEGEGGEEPERGEADHRQREPGELLARAR